MSAAAPPPERIEERLDRGGSQVAWLRLPAFAFGVVAGLRGWLYSRGLLPARRVSAPVVCVGNLSAGGTGKTPFVLWVCRQLQALGLRPAIVSRGYRAEQLERAEGEVAREAGAGDVGPRGDEARLFARALPDVRHVTDADRVRGARQAVADGADAIVLDDGFQHRRLIRDLDLVLVDSTRPWGLAWPPGQPRAPRGLLPRGLLREAPGALRRAHAVVLTRCDQATPERLAILKAEVEGLAPGVPVALARHAPQRLLDAGGGTHDLARLADREVDAVSGIGRPEAFQRTLESLGARLREHRSFPDHHAYRRADLAGLGAGGVPVLTTTKDLVKLEALLPQALALEVEFELMEGAPPLLALLESLPVARAKREREHLHEGLHG
ncbi:MAG: tetraacyldisaccharide 4'-kinase [Planctomycetota bacterium]